MEKEKRETENAEENGGEEKTSPGTVPSCEEQLDLLKKDILYMRADYDNARKRLLRDQEQALKFANEKLIRELMQVVDLFERGLEAATSLKSGEKGELGNFVNGIELTYRELINCLQRFGVEFIGAPDEPFNPEKHEAVSMQDTGIEDGTETVLHVLSKGCVLNGRVIRPAKVVVGKK